MFRISQDGVIFAANRPIGYLEGNKIFYHNQENAVCIGEFENRSEIARIIREHQIRIAKNV